MQDIAKNLPMLSNTGVIITVIIDNSSTSKRSRAFSAQKEDFLLLAILANWKENV